MIVAVKRNKKQKFIKIISFVVVILMLIAYYNHMSNKYAENKIKEEEVKKAKVLEKQKEQKRIKYEKLILAESEKAVDLIGQKNVQHIKIIDNKIVIVCDLKTNLDALMVRYGTMALIKQTINEIIVILDINYIIESKLDV